MGLVDGVALLSTHWAKGIRGPCLLVLGFAWTWASAVISLVCFLWGTEKFKD